MSIWPVSEREGKIVVIPADSKAIGIDNSMLGGELRLSFPSPAEVSATISYSDGGVKRKAQIKTGQHDKYVFVKIADLLALLPPAGDRSYRQRSCLLTA